MKRVIVISNSKCMTMIKIMKFNALCILKININVIEWLTLAIVARWFVKEHLCEKCLIIWNLY